MIETKKLAAELSSKITYELADDRILVKPLKPVMITKELPEAPKELPSNTDELDSIEKTPVKLVKTKVPANMTKGVILKLGREYETNNLNRLEIGDVVIYPTYAGVNFELFKDTRVIRRYDLIAFEKGV